MIALQGIPEGIGVKEIRNQLPDLGIDINRERHYMAMMLVQLSRTTRN